MNQFDDDDGPGDPPLAVSRPPDPTDFHAVFAALPGRFLVVAPDAPAFTILAASDAYLRATMRTREEVVGRPMFAAFPDNPDDPEASGVRNLHASLETALRTRRPHVMPVQRYDIRRPDAEGGGFEERHWEPLNSPVLGGDGRVRYLVHHVEDVTAMYGAGAALRECEERFQLVVETVRDYAIFMLDPDGRIATWNAGAGRIKGWRAEQIIGKHYRVLSTPEQQEQKLPERHLQVAAEQGCFEEENERMRKDGSRFWASVLITAVRDERGRLRGFSKVVRDITQRREAERALVEAKERAERAAREAEGANRAKDHFLAVLSHELRTPLTPVLATVTFVEKRPDLPDELRVEIGTIRRNIELEARLVDDLLDITRISRGKVELHHEAVDLHGLLRAAVQTVQPDAEAKGLDLTLGLRAKRHHVWADPTRVQQVLINLLGNAVKFTPEGRSVTARTANDGERLLVEVTDTGVGIDPEVLPRLFSPFEQGERTVTRGRGGLGLGLAISKSFVEMHGGTLTASSAGPGRGATFTITLATMPEVAEQEGAAPAPPPHAPGRRGCTILLVEDHDDTRRVMAKLLKSFGCDVKTAATVSEAVEVADRERIDLLVSDIGLPDGTGHEVMRKAKEKGIRGIALSGFGQDEDIRRSREAGFETHLVKPVNFQALEGVIRRAGVLGRA